MLVLNHCQSKENYTVQSNLSSPSTKFMDESKTEENYIEELNPSDPENINLDLSQPP